MREELAEPFLSLPQSAEAHSARPHLFAPVSSPHLVYNTTGKQTINSYRARTLSTLASYLFLASPLLQTFFTSCTPLLKTHATRRPFPNIQRMSRNARVKSASSSQCLSRHPTMELIARPKQPVMYNCNRALHLLRLQLAGDRSIGLQTTVRQHKPRGLSDWLLSAEGVTFCLFLSSTRVSRSRF